MTGYAEDPVSAGREVVVGVFVSNAGEHACVSWLTLPVTALTMRSAFIIYQWLRRSRLGEVSLKTQ